MNPSGDEVLTPNFSPLADTSALAEGATYVAHWKNSRKIAFTEPSRGMSGAKVEQTSAETLSFRCVCERCRLMRGEVGKPKCKAAFTLAEVLITLGIIGVVAALTIPTLISRYRGYVLEQQFKKSYSNLSQIVLNIKKDSGIENLKTAYVVYKDGTYVTSNVKEYYSEFQNHVNSIEKLKAAYLITNYSGTGSTVNDNAGDLPKAVYILKDGSSIGSYISNGCIRFWIDTNGPYKKPNRYGFDIFEFRINDDTDVPKPVKAYKNDYTEEELEKLPWPDYQGLPCTKNSKQLLNGVGCSWYALNNVNPDDETKKYWASLPW